MWVYRPPPETSLPPSPSALPPFCPRWPQNIGLRSKRLPGATYASMPRIGLTGVSLALVYISYAPNMLPWSLIAIAGMPCRSTSVSILPTFAAPSSIEYSL
jgi:hypothetical protein